MLLGPSAFAASAPISVSAKVVPYIKWELTAVPRFVTVNADDVTRGFIETDGGVLHIRSNDKSGFVFLFRLEPGPFVSVDVSSFEQPFEVGPGGAFFHEPLEPEMTRTTRYRLVIAKGTAPGVYPFPISLRVIGGRTLESGQ